ncbi:terpene synthase family protein [Kitasatospora viridis]|uniref:Terpene synthase n=1 Tax=Kitasatospora viridis TaxID=281105 RepID=A0A561TTJ4_9ACTN|nr:hypothetical protein [Kitasatospora viridis]TWF90436.1 hypothetical protein FHX73_13483 [Kitasatospora viridis]
MPATASPDFARRAAEADDRAAAWCLERGLLPDRETEECFRLARFGALAAHTCPSADDAALAVLGTWLGWFFLLDDHLDGHLDSQAPEDGAGLLTAIGDALRTGRTDHGSPFVAAFLDLWSAPGPGSGPAEPFRPRFARHLDEYLAALVRENAERRSGRPPGEAEYIALRRITGAIRESLDGADHLAGCSLPDELYDHPWHQSLLDAASDVINWTNDLASWRKELDGGEVHNLVLVVARTRGLDHRAAEAEVARRIAVRAEEFEALAAVPPDPRLARRAVALRDWMTGFRAWLAETARYLTDPQQPALS